ncbi:SPL family radical SAM protein [Fusobacterium sp. PH5-44]|uniref:SPL family radical SAM protein n=1 Tax=unclassified Fusobacterium TaxID=2648384 RepID=UPI003D1D56F5
MSTLKKASWSNKFSHIYVEKNAMNYDVTKEILKKLNTSKIVEIGNYNSIFSNKNQVFTLQKNAPKLILAVKKGPSMLYHGAKVCHSFNNDNFYYVTLVQNCIFDCEYCYLQGVYSSGNIVVFVNIEDIFQELDEKLKKQSIYLCISYDTDLLGIDFVTNYISKWYEYAKCHPNIKIELRTKSSNVNFFIEKKPNKNFILAWTLSPDNFVKKYEKKTALLENRLKSIAKMQELEYTVRICFDPIIYIENFFYEYTQLVKETFSVIDSNKLLDVSIGTFRISKEYLKRMRQNRPDSALIHYAYECIDGVYSYEKSLQDIIINFMKEQVENFVDKDKIYLL